MGDLLHDRVGAIVKNRLLFTPEVMVTSMRGGADVLRPCRPGRGRAPGSFRRGEPRAPGHPAPVTRRRDPVRRTPLTAPRQRTPFGGAVDGTRGLRSAAQQDQRTRAEQRTRTSTGAVRWPRSRTARTAAVKCRRLMSVTWSSAVIQAPKWRWTCPRLPAHAERDGLALLPPRDQGPDPPVVALVDGVRVHRPLRRSPSPGKVRLASSRANSPPKSRVWWSARYSFQVVTSPTSYE